MGFAFLCPFGSSGNQQAQLRSCASHVPAAFRSDGEEGIMDAMLDRAGYRIVDANVNRAREALRVMEE